MHMSHINCVHCQAQKHVVQAQKHVVQAQKHVVQAQKHVLLKNQKCPIVLLLHAYKTVALTQITCNIKRSVTKTIYYLR
jgi:chlorite dismutase